jgi:hypothetical protein
VIWIDRAMGVLGALLLLVIAGGCVETAYRCVTRGCTFLGL